MTSVENCWGKVFQRMLNWSVLLGIVLTYIFNYLIQKCKRDHTTHRQQLLKGDFAAVLFDKIWQFEDIV